MEISQDMAFKAYVLMHLYIQSNNLSFLDCLYVRSELMHPLSDLPQIRIWELVDFNREK